MIWCCPNRWFRLQHFVVAADTRESNITLPYFPSRISVVPVLFPSESHRRFLESSKAIPFIRPPPLFRRPVYSNRATSSLEVMMSLQSSLLLLLLLTGISAYSLDRQGYEVPSHEISRNCPFFIKKYTNYCLNRN